MTGNSRRAAVLAALLFATAAWSPVAAQVSATSIGVVEGDTEGAWLLLGGVSAGPRGPGWKPRFGVQAYYLTFDGTPDRVNVAVVKPYVGLRNAFTGGSFGVNVGYAFSNKDESFTAGAFVPDRGDGVVLSGGLDVWDLGEGSPLGYQLLAAYNFGTESFWGRGRGTTRLGQLSSEGRQKRIGAEVAFLSGEGYSGWQPGGILEFHTGGGRIFALGAGMKFFEGGGDAVYFKGEFVIPLGR